MIVGLLVLIIIIMLAVVCPEFLTGLFEIAVSLVGLAIWVAIIAFFIAIVSAM